MQSIKSIKHQLARRGMRLVIERDVTFGYEWLVESDVDSKTVASGFGDNKLDAAHCALVHPEVQLRLLDKAVA